MPSGVLGAVVVLVLVIGAALLVWRLGGDGDYVARPAADTAPRAEPAGATRTLSRLVTALDARDPDAAAGLGTAEEADTLRAVASNADGLQLADLSLRYVDQVGAVAADGTWQAAVDVTWSYGGVDPGPSSAEVQMSFRAVGDTVLVAATSGQGARSPLWLAGPLEVRRAPGVLVTSAGDAGSADAMLARAEAAVSVVEQVLPTWSGPLVVEEPASESQLDTALDAEPGAFANVAAVTSSVDGSVDADTPIHVFVNPEVYGALDPAGAQVVISHEATHVATDAPLHVLPIWLLEGFADYVALRDVDLPLTTTAGQVIAEVRANGAPDALPDQQDFDATSEQFGAAYEAAWLACRVVADRSGEAALVDVYEAVSAGQPVEQALADDADLSLEQLTAAWRQRLVAIVRAAPSPSGPDA